MRMRSKFVIGAVRSLDSFRHRRDGSAAVEFALVAPLFFAVLFAIIETGLVLFAGEVLESGTQDVSRLIFTGDAQSMSKADFKNRLCGRVTALFDCSKIEIDVRAFSPGSTVTIVNPIDPGTGQFINSFVYQMDQASIGSTVVVRAFYQWPLFVTQLGYNIANIDRGTINSKRLLAGTAAFVPQ